jgi:hypothetical protein
MKKYLKTTGIFFGVWFIASFVNGLLSGISLATMDSTSVNEALGILVFSMVFSFVFSAPAVGFVWFFAIMAQLAEKKGDELFQFVLRTALFWGIAGAVIFIYTLGAEFKNGRWLAGFSIIISALASVLVFRKKIKTNE